MGDSAPDHTDAMIPVLSCYHDGANGSTIQLILITVQDLESSEPYSRFWRLRHLFLSWRAGKKLRPSPHKHLHIFITFS